MRINTKCVSVGMPPAMYEALEKLAAERKQRVPAYIRWLIWRHIEEKDIAVSIFQKKEP